MKSETRLKLFHWCISRFLTVEERNDHGLQLLIQKWEEKKKKWTSHTFSFLSSPLQIRAFMMDFTCPAWLRREACTIYWREWKTLLKLDIQLYKQGTWFLDHQDRLLSGFQFPCDFVAFFISVRAHTHTQSNNLMFDHLHANTLLSFSSPYPPDILYWGERKKKQMDFKTGKEKKQQKKDKIMLGIS